MTMKETMDKAKEKMNQIIVDLTPIAKKCGEATVEAAKKTSAYIVEKTPVVTQKVTEGVNDLMAKLQKSKKEGTTDTTPPAQDATKTGTTSSTEGKDNINQNKP